jgi:hypothetical protein
MATPRVPFEDKLDAPSGGKDMEDPKTSIISHQLEKDILGIEGVVTRLRQRIYRYEHPRFLHFFVCGRLSKVVRMKDELATVCAVQKRLLTCQKGLPKSGLPQERHVLKKQKQQVASELELLTALQGHASMIQRGLRLLRQAHHLYEQALRISHEAGRTSTLEISNQCRELRDEWVMSWPEVGQLGGARQRLEAHRDALMHSANGVALCAHQELDFALTNFPQEAVERYSHLCVSIGANAYPDVHDCTEVSVSSKLLSTVTVDDEACASDAIERRLRAVSECESFAAHQLGLLAALQGGVLANMQRLRVHLEYAKRKSA